jgi:hypothetical protein
MHVFYVLYPFQGWEALLGQQDDYEYIPCLSVHVKQKSSTNISHKGTWKQIAFITQHKMQQLYSFRVQVAGFKNFSP